MADKHITYPANTTKPSFGFRVRMDGRIFRARMTHNTRDDSWFMDLSTDNGVALVQGMRMTTGHDMVGWSSDPDFPPGQLFCEDTTGAGRTPTLNSWREGIRLVYRPAADVPGFAGTALEIL